MRYTIDRSAKSWKSAFAAALKEYTKDPEIQDKTLAAELAADLISSEQEDKSTR